MHAFPVVREVVEEEAAARGLRLRVSRDVQAKGLRARVLDVFTYGRTGDLPFAGLSLWGRADYAPRLHAILRDPPAPRFEIAVHPRVDDDALRRLDRLPAETNAEAELRALTDPRSVDEIRRLCRPSGFRDLTRA